MKMKKVYTFHDSGDVSRETLRIENENGNWNEMKKDNENHN